MDRIEVKFATDDIDVKTGTFSGYGAVFGNMDQGGDVIAPGAFKASLADWKKAGKLPPMLIQHGGFGMTDMDALPIGKWIKMTEDDTGLKVEGRLINMDTERGKSIYGMLSEGVLDGMSIGYRAKEFAMGTKPKDPRRTLKVLDLVELSVVTFPMNGKARISAVKAAQEVTTIREFEDFLRDAGGFSHSQAKAIASQGFKAMDPRDEDGADLAALIRRNIAAISK